MKLEFSLAQGIELLIASGTDEKSRYPSAKIQKGLVLLHEGQDLSEEAVGLGVPVLKRGLQTLFPSEVDLYLHGGSRQTKFSARYKLNLEERISQNGNSLVNNRLLYAVKNSLAAIIRHIPLLRNLLTDTSNLLRSAMALETTYEPADFSTYVVLSYRIDEVNGIIEVELVGGDFLSNSITEVIIMNELGAHHFDQYKDSNGTRQYQDEISLWDPVTAYGATFIDQTHNVSFSLHQVNGARLFRGRELIEPRLAWAGFGYSFSPSLKTFNYAISLQRLV